MRNASATPVRRDLHGFVADIHELSGELCADLRAGRVPSTEDWMTFANLFGAAQLLWWDRQRAG